MKSRVFTITSLLALLVAMVASTSAFAQVTPGADVYNPDGEVLNVVSGGGSDTAPDEDSGTNPSNTTCAEENGSAGNSGSGGEACAPAEAGQAVASGSLPFTGFEAGLVAVAGLALLGAGMAMRRVARSDDAV